MHVILSVAVVYVMKVISYFVAKKDYFIFRTGGKAGIFMLVVIIIENMC